MERGLIAYAIQLFFVVQGWIFQTGFNDMPDESTKVPVESLKVPVEEVEVPDGNRKVPEESEDAG